MLLHEYSTFAVDPAELDRVTECECGEMMFASELEAHRDECPALHPLRRMHPDALEEELWHRGCAGGECDLGAPCRRHRLCLDVVGRYVRMRRSL